MSDTVAVTNAGLPIVAPQAASDDVDARGQPAPEWRVPVGWVAVEPRANYRRLRGSSVPWAGRLEDPDDPDVWAIACFTIRPGYRGRGLTRPLVTAAVEYARAQGAKAVEGYPMVPKPGQTVSWGEMNVGSRNTFVAAGFREVSRPTARRVVVRLDVDL